MIEQQHISKSAPVAKPIRVLLVDDHKSILWGLAQLIDGARPHMEVVGQATDRAETFALARQQQPDLILLDLALGEENSLDFLPELLHECKTRVLVLTGMRDPKLHDAAILKGARGLIHKAEPAETILKAIKKVHDGELWLDRTATGRVFETMARGGTSEADEVLAQMIDTLTTKERAVIAAIIKYRGATNRELAAHLNMGDKTLRNHLSSIYSKLSLKNRLELFGFALEHKIDP
jgi:two-component system nitrate/nitrite response regulator NarL